LEKNLGFLTDVSVVIVGYGRLDYFFHFSHHPTLDIGRKCESAIENRPNFLLVENAFLGANLLSFFQFRNLKILGIALCLASVSNLKAAPKRGPVKTITFTPKAAPLLLDTVAIRKLYLDGDFDQAVEIMETGLKEKRAFNHYDSVFIFKHLGVMYAAKYDTREKGKYFMHQLLTVEPTARILDMYASDMIYMIFKNIQDEYEETRGRYNHAETLVKGNGQSIPPKNQTGSDKEEKTAKSSNGNKTLYWVGASTVAVAAGVTAYLLLAGNTEDVETVHTLPK
jgi:hypothetical protein